MTRLLAAAFIGTVCLLAREPLLHADQPAARASALFREGRDALKRGDYAAACARFEESQELDPSLGTLLNLSVCEERRGHLLRARALLEEFLRDSEPSDDRRASAEQLVKSIDARLSRLVVQIEPSGLTDVKLGVDDRALSFEPEKPLNLDPGSHAIELRAAGYSRERVTVELASGELRRLRIVLKPLVVAESGPRSVARSSPAAVTDTKQALPPLFYVALGAGLAGAATIGGSAVMIANERATVEDHCNGKSCDLVGLAAGERGKTLVIVNTVAWPIALAGVSLAAYLVLFRNQHTKQQYAVGLTGGARPSLVFEGRL
jgi:hypothetical protein